MVVRHRLQSKGQGTRDKGREARIIGVLEASNGEEKSRWNLIWRRRLRALLTSC
jgi:hypothetical protein